MSDIIPAILTNDRDELARLVRVFERMGVMRIHLDVCDGEFVPTKTITAEDLRGLKTQMRFDVHLMVKDPQTIAAGWHDLPIERFIVHIESEGVGSDCAQKFHEYAHEFWVAKNPETPISALKEMKCDVDGVMFMTVHPGQQGNKFETGVLDQIRQFKAERPDIMIMVDGGVTPETAPQCAAAGARLLVAGSFVVNSTQPFEALQELRLSVE